MSDKSLKRVAYGPDVPATTARHNADLTPGATKETARILEQYVSANSAEKTANQMQTKVSHEEVSVMVESAIG